MNWVDVDEWHTVVSFSSALPRAPSSPLKGQAGCMAMEDGCAYSNILIAEARLASNYPPRSRPPTR
jgi:hypothetical protein